MPIYEYRCSDCKHVFSRLQRMGADAGGVRCPRCDSFKLERLISAFASSSSRTSAGAPAGPCGPST